MAAVYRHGVRHDQVGRLDEDRPFRILHCLYQLLRRFDPHPVVLYVLLLPVALLMSPLERRGRPADAKVPSAIRQVGGAMMVCLGVALLAMYGYGGGPMPRIDVASFALVVVGSGISGLLPGFK